jgi:radical SAM superfamily enzyme YgiQ (UPF0313 family)
VVPAIGLAILAARLREHEVKIYDLNHQPTLDLNADVVGVTDLYANHANAIDIMRAAKEESATTVIGGPNVSFLAERILRNNPFVDYAIVADGEDALPALLAGNKPENIPNLVFRDGERIVRNPRQRVRMDTLFDLDDVVGLDIDPGKLYTINAIRGCAKAEKEGRCSFCSLDLALNVMDPALVWEQIGILNSKYGLTRFFEAGDTFMVGKFPEKLLAARPSRLENTSFRVYASADEITPESSKLLAALHVEEILSASRVTTIEFLNKQEKVIVQQILITQSLCCTNKESDCTCLSSTACRVKRLRPQKPHSGLQKNMQTLVGFIASSAHLQFHFLARNYSRIFVQIRKQQHPILATLTEMTSLITKR